ncbi:MAG: hypothetical protein A3G17_00050 [Planctomycetes bacterium RIFCSPLOWO2_12_FULL_50_35]|nr:MAG: hypothetical protein A3G17_00050 [Planctomycetes bacterium RIFCSPLOWO2_12_FULL_50_35]
MVMKIFNKSWVWGTVGGLVVAGLIAVMSLTGLAEKAGLEGVINFLSALPVFLVMKLWPEAPEFLTVIILFLYWTGLGALAGWAIGKGRTWKIGLAIGLLVLAFAHFWAKSNIELQLEGAARAFELFIRDIERSLQEGAKK